MLRAYTFLLFAIVSEVCGTWALKASGGFTRALPSAITVVGYVASAYCLALCLRAGLGLGVSYAIWCGLGIVLITVIGAVAYHEKIDLPAIIGFALIIAGVVVLYLFSKTARG